MGNLGLKKLTKPLVDLFLSQTKFSLSLRSESTSKKELLSSAHAEKRLSIMNEEDEATGGDEKRISSQNISQV